MAEHDKEMSAAVNPASYVHDACAAEAVVREISFYTVVKRIFDICAALIGCFLSVIMAAFVKVCFVLEGDFSPIIYTQDRVGKDGNVFKMYKFRTMVPDADRILKSLIREEPYRSQWNRDQKLEDDPRITSAGKFLRKTSLDEFPQFINVLKGEMSLIGPRPLVPGELADHGGTPFYNTVTPGITGWWACNGRSDTSYEKRLELEYYYIKNRSLKLDVLCIVKTVMAVINKTGAK